MGYSMPKGQTRKLRYSHMPELVWVIWEKVKTQNQVRPYHLLFYTALLPSPNKFLLPAKVQSRDSLAVSWKNHQAGDSKPAHPGDRRQVDHTCCLSGAQRLPTGLNGISAFWKSADPSLVLIILDVEHMASLFIQELTLPVTV